MLGNLMMAVLSYQFQNLCDKNIFSGECVASSLFEDNRLFLVNCASKALQSQPFGDKVLF